MRKLLFALFATVPMVFAAAQNPPPPPPSKPTPPPVPRAPAAPSPARPRAGFRTEPREWIEELLQATRAQEELRARAEELQHTALARQEEMRTRAEELQHAALARQEELRAHAEELQQAAQERAREVEWSLLPDLQARLSELQFQLPPVPPVEFPEFSLHFWGNDLPELHGALGRLRPEQGSPEDSLYRAAREALNRGEWARASMLFQSLEQKYPRSRVAPAALYYQAFALYRSGATEQLRAAVEALKAQQQRYPEAAADPDAGALRTRLYAALAARGDAQAAAALRAATAAGPSCDEEDMAVRAEALNALAQLDPQGASTALKKVLARRDECSVTLRRRAVYLLARAGTEQATTDLLEVARTDPDNSVRSDAISLLGRSNFTSVTVQVLERLFNENPDEQIRQAVLSALRYRGSPEARRALRGIIERSDVPERMRAQAISQLANFTGWEPMLLATIRYAVPVRESTAARERAVTAIRRGEAGLEEEDAAFLRGLYSKTDSRAIKSAILSAVGRSGGPANEQWLLAIVRNPVEDSSLRREALARLKSSAISVEDLGKLFDALSERELRLAVVSQLASRDEAGATDKLIEIAKSSTDPRVRSQAIQALTRKKDPKAVNFIRELVEKP